MASKVEIVNRALSKLGQARITSFDDGTKPSDLAAAIYEDVAKDVMAAGCWSSCIQRASLATLATAPTWGYDYAYALPTDPLCLSVIKMNEGSPGDIDFKIEGSSLLTNESVAEILYVGYITDSESYDVYLKQAIIWQLVAEMAYDCTGDVGTAMELIKTAESMKQQLLTLNNLQGSNDMLGSDEYLDARED